jgi:hypothetical protein
VAADRRCWGTRLLSGCGEAVWRQPSKKRSTVKTEDNKAYLLDYTQIWEREKSSRTTDANVCQKR